MKNLVKAVLAVMAECEGIDKSMTVGMGQNSYKGVSDKDVKLKVGKSMQKHGLIILPTGVKPNTTINHYEDQYGKPKMSVFAEVITEYLLIHESGESTPLVGFGHGTDTQDKAAGKATTYALKYTLLYSFLVATGHIDDTDNTHSDDIAVPPVKSKPAKATPAAPPAEDKSAALDALAIIGAYTDMFNACVKAEYLNEEQKKSCTPTAAWNEEKYRKAYNWLAPRKEAWDAAAIAAKEEKSQAVKNVRMQS
jgi:hypothetical protein